MCVFIYVCNKELDMHVWWTCADTAAFFTSEPLATATDTRREEAKHLRDALREKVTEIDEGVSWVKFIDI